MPPQNAAFCFVPPAPSPCPPVLRDVTFRPLLEPPSAFPLREFPHSPPHSTHGADLTHTCQAGAEANPAIDRRAKRAALGSVARSDGAGHLDSHGRAHCPPDMLGPRFCFWLPKKGLFCLTLRDPGPEVGPGCGLNRVSLSLSQNSCVEALTIITSECDVFKDRAL